MINYIKAEQLKCKHTAITKLTWITPIVLMILAVLLTGNYFVVDYFNWWYISIMPAILTLNCCMFHKLESKMKYRAILPLPLSRQKIWYAKVLIMTEKLVISCLVIFVTAAIGVHLIDMIGISSKLHVSIVNMFLASLVICVAGSWQVPLCLFLANKIGIFPLLFLNVAFNFVCCVTVSLTKYWILVPYSYIARAMCPILRILPNGLVAEKGSMTFYEGLLSWNVVIPGIFISLILFLVITYITGKWFCKREAV
jgi:ABC-2 type transport system permease protein